MKRLLLQTCVIAFGTFLILGSEGPQYGDLTYDDDTETGTSSEVDTPSDVEAMSAYKAVILTWDEDDDASGFKICYATEAITDFDSCEDYEDGTYYTMGSSNSVVIDGLSAIQRYYFRIVAEDDSDEYSTASANISVSPGLGLNDTGITVCREEGSEDVTCSSDSYPNQDADNGLDVAANDNTDGHAGFDFTRMDSDGDGVSSTASDWDCARDNNTGLIWEVKYRSGDSITTGDNGQNDADDLFTWYSTDSDTNAGTTGISNSDSDTCSGYDSSDSSTYCNTQAYVNRLNDDEYCGLTNWRMPTRDELVSIINYDQVEPAIAIGVFPYTASDVYWSGTSVYSSSISGDQAWATNFNYGGSAKEVKTESYRVRLVSDGK